MISGLSSLGKYNCGICKRTIPYFGLGGSLMEIRQLNDRSRPRIVSVSADRRSMGAACLDRLFPVNPTQGSRFAATLKL